MYRKDSSSVVSGCRISRAAGPQRPRHAYFEVTSSTCTESGACIRIHARSCRPNAVPVTMRKRSSASRVTVKSHSTPPRGLSICVYVIAPTSRATRFAHSRSRKSGASLPAISIFAKEVSSNSAAVVRQAVCSAPIAGDELPHAAGAREPVRAEPGRDPEAADVGRAEDELAVGRERLGPVDQADHLGIAELGHAHECVLHQLLEARPILGEQLAVEIGR